MGLSSTNGGQPIGKYGSNRERPLKTILAHDGVGKAGMPPLTEKEITQQIRQVLKLCRIKHWKAWGGPMSEKGIPDIIGILPGGRFLGIEIKRPGGRVSPEQAKWIQNINDSGGIAFVAYSVDEVVDRLGLGVKLNPMFGGQVRRGS